MDNLIWGLQTTVLGMGLVFALLALLWGLLTLVLRLDKEPAEPVLGEAPASEPRLPALAQAGTGADASALRAEGHAVIVSTHDVEFAAGAAHRVVVLADGEVVADGPTAEVVVSSPAFAPQVAKVLQPQAWLTVAEVEAALTTGAPT